ncbi:MAG: lipid A export permease/ATP-binding protein MsbA [Burkholderiaceae bacterium]
MKTDATPSLADPNTPTTPNLLLRLQRIWPYFKGGVRGLIWMTLATLIAAATEPMIPALLEQLLDKGFGRTNLNLWLVPLAILSVFAVRGIAVFFAQYLLSYVANGAMLELRRAMFARLTVADLQLFRNESASSLSNTIVYEVQNGTTQLIGAVLSLLRDSLTLLALLAYLFYLNWQLTLIVLLVFPALTAVMRLLSRRLYHVTKRSQTATDALAYVVEENVLAHRIIRLHGAQAQQADRFDGFSQKLRGLALRATIASAAMTPITQLLAACALSAVIVVALWQSSAGDATVGSFVAFVTAMLMLVTPIRRLADVLTPITRGVAAIERGLLLMDNVPAQVGGSYAPSEGSGEIDFVETSVTYGSTTTPALKRLNLHIKSGQVVALVGPSGAGKTTLINLLPRFVDASAGSIKVDGVEVREWNLTALRGQFALVSQDVVMLNDSLAANITLGQTLDMQRLEACIDAANLNDVVRGLPDGVETQLGHNATQLSGGQRQRLAIARALYKDAPILLLDEATSALDNASERLVQEAMTRLMKGRTTLIVAHRLSTIEHADRVIVMADGEMKEDGTHASLMQAGGLYTHLHQKAAQSQPDTQPTVD